MKSVVADAYNFVDDAASGPKFDISIMDLNYEEENINLSPPQKFLETEFLDKLVKLSTQDGLVAFNLLCMEKELLSLTYNKILSSSAEGKYLIEGEEDANKVIVLTRKQAVSEDDRQTQMEKLLKEFGLNKGLWLTEMRIK